MPQRRNIPDDNDIILGQNLLSNDGDSVFDIILDLESGKVSTTDDVGADAAVAGNGGDDEFAKSILEDAAAEKAAEKAEKPVEITENAAEIAENAGETPDIIGETAEKTGEGSADNEIPGGEDVSAEEESSGEDGISDEEDISAEDASGGDLPDAEGDDFQDIGGEELPDIGDDELQETGDGKLPETGDDELPDIAEEDGGLFDDNITEESVPAKDAPADAGQESAVLAALIGGKGEPAEADGTNGGIFVIGGVADKAPDNAADAAEDLRKAPEDGTNGAPGEKSPEDLKTEEDSLALRALLRASEGRNEPGADTVNTDKLSELATEMDESREYTGSGAKLRNILGLSMPDSNGSKTIGGITHGMWAIIILLVFLADVILINFVVSRLVYPAVSAVMNETGHVRDAVHGDILRDRVPGRRTDSVFDLQDRADTDGGGRHRESGHGDQGGAADRRGDLRCRRDRSDADNAQGNIHGDGLPLDLPDGGLRRGSAFLRGLRNRRQEEKQIRRSQTRDSDEGFG